MPRRSSTLLVLPKELLEHVLSHCSPFDIARAAAISHLFHDSLAVDSSLLWAREHGFELALPDGDSCVLRSLCLSALMQQSNPGELTKPLSLGRDAKVWRGKRVQ